MQPANSKMNKGALRATNTIGYFNEIIYERLLTQYKKSVLDKKELSQELGISVSTINNYIAKGAGIPEYIKIGIGINSRVLFPIENVVAYMSNTIKIA